MTHNYEALHRIFMVTLILMIFTANGLKTTREIKLKITI